MATTKAMSNAGLSLVEGDTIPKSIDNGTTKSAAIKSSDISVSQIKTNLAGKYLLNKKYIPAPTYAHLKGSNMQRNNRLC